MRTIFVVHCITGPDSAWLDRDVAEARARKMDMRVAEVPMPDYGDALPPCEPPAWNGCPPGYDGGPSVPWLRTRPAMTTLTTKSARVLAKLGASKGGKASAAKLTPTQRKRRAQRAARARWKPREKP